MQRKNIIRVMLLLLVLLNSCTNKNADTIKVINIDMNSVNETDMNQLFSKIELVPLQTTEASLIANIRRMVFANEFIIISDNKNIISVFDRKGQFISNSKKRYGQGPEDYGILMGFTFNEFTKSIDLITPNYLISYDIYFNCINKSKLFTQAKISEKDRGLYFENIFALDKDKYLLLPTTISNDPHRIIFYSKNKQSDIDASYADQVISGLTQQVNNIQSYDDSSYSFSPNGFSYYLYTIDKKTLELKKKFKFDFGSHQVKKEDLKHLKGDREKADFLAFSSTSPLPLRTFFNKDFIVSQIKEGKRYSSYFNSGNRPNGLLMKNNLFEGNKRLPFFETLRNNVLYAQINITELDKFIDLKLIDENSLVLLKQLKPDDNPCIVKYYLK